MTYLREKTVCFTGHRPEKLPGYGETENASLNVIRSMLYYQIYQSAEEGYKYFISGLARGVDLWAAEYVLEVKTDFLILSLSVQSLLPHTEKILKIRICGACQTLLKRQMNSYVYRKVIQETATDLEISIWWTDRQS